MNAKRFFLTSVASAVLTAAVCPISADTIVLKGGHKVTGEVLKADKDVVIVDLGVTVLRLRRAQVVRIVRDKPATTAAASAPTAPKEKKGDKWRLYRTAELKPTTIEKNADRFGEAVVMVTTPGGQGSGFVISPDGHLITNYHVVAHETRIKITIFSRSDRGYEQKHHKKVRIIAINPYADLALLKIEPDKPAKAPKAETVFKYAYLGRIGEVEAGQRCFAIGNPLGLTRTVSQGIVSTKNRNFEGRLYVQTTTAINPGNSGGPLFNTRGEVIGVTSMGYIYLGGLNFAIPVEVVKRFIRNRDAFAYDEDNPNSGYRYLQPGGRKNKAKPPVGKLPTMADAQTAAATKKTGDKPDSR